MTLMGIAIFLLSTDVIILTWRFVLLEKAVRKLKNRADSLVLLQNPPGSLHPQAFSKYYMDNWLRAIDDPIVASIFLDHYIFSSPYRTHDRLRGIVQEAVRIDRGQWLKWIDQHENNPSVRAVLGKEERMNS